MNKTIYVKFTAGKVVSPLAKEPVDRTLKIYLEEVAGSMPLSSEEEAELAGRIRNGDVDARNRLTHANLRFVVSVAQEYKYRGLTLGELISAGNMGLMDAAVRFDETQGFRFISYAVWWVRQAILKSLSEQRVVRIPVNRAEMLRRIYRCVQVLTQELGREPRVEEVAEELGYSVAEIENFLEDGHGILSLDKPFDDDDNENTLADLVPGDSENRPDAQLERQKLKDEIEAVIGTLEGREAEVVRLYFGLGGITEMTLEEIGVKFGITRERVRQIKEKALRKLRHPSRGKRLIPYVEQGVSLSKKRHKNKPQNPSRVAG